MFPEVYIGDLYDYEFILTADMSVSFDRNRSTRKDDAVFHLNISNKYYYSDKGLSEMNTVPSTHAMPLTAMLMKMGKNASFMSNMTALFIVVPRNTHHRQYSSRKTLMLASQNVEQKEMTYKPLCEELTEGFEDVHC